jgi:hypothetical protein
MVGHGRGPGGRPAGSRSPRVPGAGATPGESDMRSGHTRSLRRRHGGRPGLPHRGRPGYGSRQCSRLRRELRRKPAPGSSVGSTSDERRRIELLPVTVTLSTNRPASRHPRTLTDALTRTQTPMSASSCEFKSHLRHHRRTNRWQKRGCAKAAFCNSVPRWGSTVLPPPSAPTRAAAARILGARIPGPVMQSAPFLVSRWDGVCYRGAR